MPGTICGFGRRLAVIVNVAVRGGVLVSVDVMTMVRVSAVDMSMVASRPAIAVPPSIVIVVVIGVRPPSTSATMRDVSGSCTVAAVSDTRTMP